MLEHLNLWQRVILFAAMALWAVTSIVSVSLGHARIFAALGSFALCIGFVVFLTDRYLAQEARRHWDSQILTQSRMIWRYMLRLEDPQITDPTPLPVLRERITENFESLLAAKAEEKKMETYRYEMVFSVLGTLQWGFGELVIGIFKGG
ncbi:MAG: hypothetical protein L3J37_12540 [Rhodobacteraceae bacterium]|nr:hypothetical protein [Paracoccaceae bacterium]